MFAGGYGSGGFHSDVDIFTIPEPATLGMLVVGGLAMVGRWRSVRQL